MNPAPLGRDDIRRNRSFDYVGNTTPNGAVQTEWIAMKQLNLAEAKAKLSRLVSQVAKGKGVIIAKSGVPMAKLVPLHDDKPKEFMFGTLKGVLTDDLVEAIEMPLPDDILDLMSHGLPERGMTAKR
jgi:prevent-host-death family protein